ncbi:hypothetical protein J1G42_13625 [Cellulomonas sp. zg-ZUI222]|uniref:Uncharacterized protein n=1 Tax=Cellulomonas wangleii TaxID=2816956 RepID=A0ABX8D644_9CELL|nr:hypothetical protein [Cellulomonas wangleii]MBO0921864.1 hypothetical protein [Cellulomonas wangleii]MBO0924714.1 hypothetical protein [Cellulomonas wangleii]QVI62900.1 hypothetical protein KG103_02895 [Cellulomonas wangleii]
MVDALIEAPLGRLFLRELADLTGPEGLTDDLVWQAFHSALALSVQQLHLPDAHAVVPGAHELAAAVRERMGWWWSPAPAEQTGLEDLAYAGPRVGSLQDGWWTRPEGAVQTSRRLSGTDVCVHLLHRAGHDLEPTRPLLWDATVAGARVLEIRTADDWCALVASAPRRHRGDMQVPRAYRRLPVYQPHWDQVAADGVHVTPGALITSGHTPLPVLDGFTYLAGWHPDVTAWLNPAPLFREGSRPLRLGMPQR